ncbi:hypothetical protein MIND_01227400 [Mycena indigotica]|uniref:DUF6534 domain-containing protein n=1 Tax=Mycena indigotica TaxID=2126181 RepID=A0A8H6S568_9AGAR|nr:uncharacterized protein MIND_01227400 [Mycena indigotica]KAF7292017.1 hypothetical protein MIND_01227400 [Mycena indigotica]
MTHSQTVHALVIRSTVFGQLLSSQLIGMLFDCVLTGALFIQMLVYHICFPKDSVAFKTLVYGLLLLMLGRLCLIAYEAQYFYADGFGDVARLSTQTRHQYSYALVPITVCIVQQFFGYRILSLDRRLWPVCLLISLLSLGQCCVAYVGLGIVYAGSPASLLSKLALVSNLVRAWYITGMLTALLNTVTTVMALLRLRSINSLTKRAVQNVVRFTIESNAASTVVEIVSLALLQAYPTTTYYVGTSVLLSGVYTNMLLATLNYRAIVRQQSAPPSTEATATTAPSVPSRPSTLVQPATEKVHPRDSVTIRSGSSVPTDGGSTRQSQDNLKQRPQSVQQRPLNSLPPAENYRPGDVEIRVDQERSSVVD